MQQRKLEDIRYPKKKKTEISGYPIYSAILVLNILTGDPDHGMSFSPPEVKYFLMAKDLTRMLYSRSPCHLHY
jgi:hypothetical protein